MPDPPALEDTQNLNAPACYDIPNKLDIRLVVDLLCRMDGVLLQEIFTLSAKSVLYELVLCFVEKYADKAEVEVIRSCQVAKCYDFFSVNLQVFELDVLLTECKKLLLCNIEAKSNIVRFEASLRGMFSVACNRFSLVGEGDLAQGETVLRISDNPMCCYAEEIDEEVLRFHDVKGEDHKKEVQRMIREQDEKAKKDANPKPKAKKRLLWFDYVNAKTAYAVAMYMWVAIHMLLKRLAVVGKYREEHPSDLICGETLTVELTRKLTEVFDSFQAALQRAEQRKEAGNQLYHQQLWPDAIREYSKAIELSPPGDDNRYIYYSNRAACFNQVGEYQRAVEDCTIALSYNPRFFKTLYRRAQAYERLGKKSLAVSDLEQLLSLYPNNVQGREYHDRITAKKPSSDEQPPVTPQPPTTAPVVTPASSVLSNGSVTDGAVKMEDEEDNVDDSSKRRRKNKKKKKKGEDDTEDKTKMEEEQQRAAEEEQRRAAEEEQRRAAEEAACQAKQREQEERQLKEQRSRKEQERREREKMEQERREKEQQERRAQRDRAEREKQEKKAREEQERKEREDRERREREERDLMRRIREQQRREQREREERERKLREDRERAIREKEERAAKEREEREQREREQRRERMERKERERAEREKAEKERREKERKEREKKEKEQREARAKKDTSVTLPAPPSSAAPTMPPAPAPASSTPSTSSPPPAPSTSLISPTASKPTGPVKSSAGPTSPAGVAAPASTGRAWAKLPKPPPAMQQQAPVSPKAAKPIVHATSPKQHTAASPQPKPAPSRMAPVSPPCSPPKDPMHTFPAFIGTDSSSLFTSPHMTLPSNRAPYGWNSSGLPPDNSGYGDLLDLGVNDTPEPLDLPTGPSSHLSLEQEVAGNTSATSFFTGLDDINPIADALSHLFQVAGISPAPRNPGPIGSSPFSLSDRWPLSGILAPMAPGSSVNNDGRPRSPRGVSLLDSVPLDTPPTSVDLLGGPTRFQLHPMAHRRLPGSC